MSYTPPQYVDTKEQAILALASTIKGEAVTGGDGSVNRALDILADVLAEQDVSVPQTDAGAILALASYASGMVKPEGAIAITQNGEGIDVAQYATANVSVSGGGGSATTDVYLWNLSEDESFIGVAFDKVLVQTGLNDLQLPVFEEVAFTPITETIQGVTVQGAKVEGVPCGALIQAKVGSALNATFSTGYGQNGDVMDASMRARLITGESQGIALMPVDGFKCVCAVVPQGNV